ncbi:hypothetical protein [Streptomyces albipurpureus]|uniref:Uncharacterized protein n=1 Tax=Streptomyces albipurpureus TaxID=2897419 RepID=A0ABT0UMZ3_9ACTN|nr:hypothetical protein [Streptomyces sp. CWNU-1]MCM2388990.1 hypothetical protein [Streptomyces sp. CWNU-1]
MSETEHRPDTDTRPYPDDPPKVGPAHQVVFVLAVLALVGSLVIALLRSAGGDAP